MWKAKFWYYYLFICLLFPFTLIAQQQITAPDSVLTTLNALKKENNLTDWLYARIDYAYIHPRESLPFLMNTQKESWRKAITAPEKEAWLLLLINQAYNQLYSGNILGSIDYYELAYNYWNDQKLKADIYDFILKPWANNYTRLGDYEKAIFIQQKTLDFTLKGHNNQLTASIYNNLAISYRSVGNFKKAIGCVALGLEKISNSDPLNILLNNTLADIYTDQNEIKTAERIISKNIETQKGIKKTFETAYWLLSSYITAGDIQLTLNNYDQAQHYYQLGLEVNKQYYKGNRLREKARIITQLGKIKLAQKQGNAALAYFNETLNLLGLITEKQQVNHQLIFGDNRLTEVFYQRSLAYSLTGNPEKALESIRFALAAADKIRFELADVRTRQRFQAETKQMAEKAINIAFGLLEKTKSQYYATQILDIIEQTKARTLLDDIRRNQQQLSLKTKDPLLNEKLNLEKAIAYHERTNLQEGTGDPDATKVLDELKFKLNYTEKKLRQQYSPSTQNADATLTVSTILKQVPKHAQLIEFFVGQDYIYIIQIKDNRIKHVKRIINAENIKENIAEFVRTYYQNGPEAMTNNPEKFFHASYQIYRDLLGDFDSGNKKNLIIIPDEIIGYLSFEGLITDKTYQSNISKWPYLIKQQSVHYAFSIQTLLNQSKEKGGERKTQESFSGLFIDHQNKGKEFLPAVTKELKSLKDIISGVFLLNEEASIKNFFNIFENTKILHISTHAYLSGQQQEPTLDLNDGKVFLFELSARQHAPSLVVLSACRTADGIMAKGEGIISFSRGFSAIGTQGTIAGLWNINDDAAADITSTTYQNILKNESINSALHHAKLNWLNTQKGSEQEYLPYYWSPLIYTGYDQTIPLKKSGSVYGLIAVTAAVTAIAAFILMRRKR